MTSLAKSRYDQGRSALPSPVKLTSLFSAKRNDILTLRWPTQPTGMS